MHGPVARQRRRLLRPGRHLLIVTTFGLCSYGILTGTAPQAAPPPPDAGKPTPPTSPISQWRKALDQKGDFVLQNVSLKEAIENIGRQAKIPVEIDLSVANFGLDVISPIINLEMRDVTVKKALDKLLTPFNLHYALLPQGLIVSSEEGVTARQLRQRVQVSFEQLVLSEIVDHLVQSTGANLVLDPRLPTPSRRISLRLPQEMPLEQAVRLVAELSDLRVVRLGNTLIITTPERAERLRTDADGPTTPLPPNPSLPPFVVPGGAPLFPGAVPGFPGIGADRGVEDGVAEIAVPRPAAKPAEKK